MSKTITAPDWIEVFSDDKMSTHVLPTENATVEEIEGAIAILETRRVANAVDIQGLRAELARRNGEPVDVRFRDEVTMTELEAALGLFSEKEDVNRALNKLVDDAQLVVVLAGSHRCMVSYCEVNADGELVVQLEDQEKQT